MSRENNARRRSSTTVRDNHVHEIYADLRQRLGGLADVVSKGYIYDEITRHTGLCHRTIAYILNHTRPIIGSKLPH